MPGIDKVLFVVDRKDLDYQTIKEYDRFEKGAANGNASTSELKKQLESDSSRIVVTTIQKLSIFVTKNPKHPTFSKRIVLIFDECHRSQFGDMHTAIRKAFKNYNLFGFTGTPIFAENASSGKNLDLRTTEQAFGDKLHTYTIVDAIADKNVLPFRVDYINTVKSVEDLADKQVSAIDTERVLISSERISKVVDYILEHFDQKTKRNQSYKLNDKRVAGFNSLFATASIEAAKKYYQSFQEAQKDLPSDKQLKVGIIFSYSANEEEIDGLPVEEGFDTDALDQSSRDFLESAIQDYNKMFKTNWDTSADNFQSYYKDLSGKLKNREIDLVIVVNMFLTGFDSTTLNTLWVDKNLRQHGLIQAFSRTNRILNSVKTYGNIVCFRDLEKATTDAISLFGNKEAGGVVLLKPFAHYFERYQEAADSILSKFEVGELPIGEQAQKEFINLFNEILNLRNILTSFDDFAEQEIISPAQLQDLQSVFIELYTQFKNTKESDRESILDDLVFELELVKQIEINVDYILSLVRQLQESKGDAAANKEIEANISRAIDSSVTLRSKKDLIERFLSQLNVETDVDKGWRNFIEEQRQIELEEIIQEERLDPAGTHVFMDQAFEEGQVATVGTAFTRLIPAKSMFSPEDEHGEQKKRVAERLQAFFERFFSL
jgi:type I restriction enzyme R subunit